MVFAVQDGASNMGNNAGMRGTLRRKKKKKHRAKYKATLSLSKKNSMPFTWKHRLPLPKDEVHPWYGLGGSGRVEPVGVDIRWSRAGIKWEGPVKERMLDLLENEEVVVVEKDDDIDDEDDEDSHEILMRMAVFFVNARYQCPDDDHSHLSIMELLVCCPVIIFSIHYTSASGFMLKLGRLDRKIEIPFPNEQSGMEILKIHVVGIAKHGEMDYEAAEVYYDLNLDQWHYVRGSMGLIFVTCALKLVKNKREKDKIGTKPNKNRK
nr:26S proteasome regulatory subunit S10B homolog B-like [Tanacetum cinerariifolium]